MMSFVKTLPFLLTYSQLSISKTDTSKSPFISKNITQTFPILYSNPFISKKLFCEQNLYLEIAMDGDELQL